MAIMTFQKILRACEEGNREAWRDFLADYTPIAYQLLDFYLPLPPEARREFWREALKDFGDNDFERLRSFEHQAEREFLVDLRAFLFDRAASRIDPVQDAGTPPCPTVEKLGALLMGLPLLHQEIVFLTLAGYSHAALEKILRITPNVAQQGLERLKVDFAFVLDRQANKCLWPAGWIRITRAARAAKQPDCVPLRQLVRILDGQASWYDKTPVEEHRTTCFYCLEHWTALLEVVAWERQAEPCAPEEIEPLLASLPLPTHGEGHEPFFKRLFAQFGPKP